MTPATTATAGVPRGASRSLPSWRVPPGRGACQSSTKKTGEGTGQRIANTVPGGYVVVVVGVARGAMHPARAAAPVTAAATSPAILPTPGFSAPRAPALTRAVGSDPFGDLPVLDVDGARDADRVEQPAVVGD